MTNISHICFVMAPLATVEGFGSNSGNHGKCDGQGVA